MLQPTDADRLAYALTNLLASWWRGHGAGPRSNQSADAPGANWVVPHRETSATQESRSEEH